MTVDPYCQVVDLLDSDVVAALAVDLTRVPADAWRPHKYPGWGSAPLRSVDGDPDAARFTHRDDWPRLADTDLFAAQPAVRALLRRFDGVGSVRWLSAEPGTVVPWHVDQLPKGVWRFHVPVADDLYASIDWGQGPRHMICGYVYRINARKRHRLDGGARRRVHLVVDAEQYHPRA